jgi:hypothetical protein
MGAVRSLDVVLHTGTTARLAVGSATLALLLTPRVLVTAMLGPESVLT